MATNRDPTLVNIVLSACQRNRTDKVTFGIFEAMKQTGMIGNHERFQNYEGRPVQDFVPVQVNEDVGYKTTHDAMSCLIARGGSYSIVGGESHSRPYQ